MSQINPFTGSVLQAPQVQRQQATEKDRSLRRAADASKNAALAEDRLEHQVESSDLVTPAHEDERHEQQKRKSRKRATATESNSSASDDENPHVDLTA